MFAKDRRQRKAESSVLLRVFRGGRRRLLLCQLPIEHRDESEMLNDRNNKRDHSAVLNGMTICDWIGLADVDF